MQLTSIASSLTRDLLSRRDLFTRTAAGFAGIALGSLLATHSLEHVGPQEYELDPVRFVARFAAAFGDAAAAEVGGFLS